MLDVDKNFNEHVTKLYGLDVNICFEKENIDYISVLHSAEKPDEVLEGLESHKREGLVKEIQRTAKKDSQEIKNQTIYVGSIDPSKLNRAMDYYDFFRILLQNDLNYRKKAKDFLLRLAVSEKMNKGIPSDLKKLTDEMTACIQGNADTTKEFELLCNMRDDFISLGQYISYNRLGFISTFIFPLFDKLEGDRRTLLDNILNRKYPFTDDKIREWEDLIREY